LNYYPVFIDLRGQPAVVLGGSALATEKAEGLTEAGARVRVICLEPSERLRDLARSGLLELVGRDFQADDLAGARIAIDASDDMAINRQSWEEAERLGVLINVVDRPLQCRFIAPALVRRDPLLVAISTSGESPYLASALRRRLELLLGEEWGPFVEMVGGIRRRLRSGGVSLGRQTRVYRRLLSSGVRGLLRDGRRAEAVLEADRIAGVGRAPDQPGRVALVGAGPGDAGLLTLKAQEVLAEADWVFHDALVTPDILAMCPPQARLIDVGKRAGRRNPDQEDITAQLIETARAGHQVVRLKAGDPFIFGRGGEELQALVAAGLEVLVVPGVSAAVAAAGAAGIPLTMRGVASSVAFVTARNRRGVLPDGLEALAAEVDTLVVLMPLADLAGLTRRLAAVVGPDRPAALVAEATTPRQRVVRAPLGDLARLAVEAGIQAPATLIVGEVARVAEPLPQWADAGTGAAYG
jgi:uroporphyrin-III C-methyltransferase/precorrin-2 dehydrogenase/sirohydrochlorin ferrochelatase